MKIAIIGAGNVGTALGSAWEEAGHAVVYGVRNPSPNSHEMNVEEAVSISDIIVLAVPWGAIPKVLERKEVFTGKIVIDCTNPIKADFSGLEVGHSDSGGEIVARQIPDAFVVKAFNTCGFNIMANPNFPGGKASMLIATDNAAAKDAAMSLSRAAGFEPVYAGPLVQSRGLEALAWLWISMAMKFGSGREIAFSLLRR